MVDVTNVPSSAAFMSFLPKSQPITRVTRPQIVTQEPTVGKTSPSRKDTQHVGKEIDTQEPTSAMEVEPQEPVLCHVGTRIEEHSESHIIKDTMTMLKDLAQTVIATAS